jgi:hypothetical protein
MYEVTRHKEDVWPLAWFCSRKASFVRRG